MKKIILSSIAAILITTPSFATEETHHSATIKFCNAMAVVAEQIMAGRQSGELVFQDFLIVVKDNIHAEALLRVAWQRPRYGSAEFKLMAIQEFKEETFVWCYQNYK